MYLEVDMNKYGNVRFLSYGEKYVFSRYPLLSPLRRVSYKNPVIKQLKDGSCFKAMFNVTRMYSSLFVVEVTSVGNSVV